MHHRIPRLRLSNIGIISKGVQFANQYVHAVISVCSKQAAWEYHYNPFLPRPEIPGPSANKLSVAESQRKCCTAGRHLKECIYYHKSNNTRLSSVGIQSMHHCQHDFIYHATGRHNRHEMETAIHCLDKFMELHSMGIKEYITEEATTNRLSSIGNHIISDSLHT